MGEPGITYYHIHTLSDEFLLRIFIHIYIYTIIYVPRARKWVE